MRVDNRVGYRSVSFPDGRTLVVRPTSGADVDGLALLYTSLPEEDLRYRFFSLYHPPRSFYEKQAHLDDLGGCGLVAKIRGSGRILSDAGFLPLPDGGAEFALTVAPDWRGWLGPYMLDALVEVAAARGLPNLQADVLTENHRMLALLKRRGYVMVGNDDYSVMHIAIATTESMPFWPRRHHSRLVVAEVQAGHWAGERAALRAGWHLVACSRYRWTGRQACPALRGEQCALARGADYLVIGHSVKDQRNDLIAAHKALHPDVPVTVAGGDDDVQIREVIATVQSRRRRSTKGDPLVKRSRGGEPATTEDRTRG